MNVQKFVANSSREAWQQVRKVLGPDAIILSNRTTKEGIEILAVADDEISSVTVPAMHSAPVYKRVDSAAQEAAMPVQPTMTDKPLSAAIVSEQPAVQQVRKVVFPKDTAVSSKPIIIDEPIEQPARNPAYVDVRVWRNRNQPVKTASQEPVVPAAPVAPVAAAPEKTPVQETVISAPDKNYVEILNEVMNEIRSMRGVIESQLAEITWNNTQKREPIKAQVLREMLMAGFSASLSRLIAENLPSNIKEGDALLWVRSVLARNLQVLDNEDSLLDHGGVYAMVGPTGVGKTTTTAKLAARCVMRHGPSKLALISTDGYRIGGYEQLRIYGKILGVMVHSVRDESDLKLALSELQGKHTILIDTVGVGQRDKMVAEQIAMLSGNDKNIKRILCLNATSTSSTLNEVVRAYRGDKLDGCILTKLDEAATIGNVLDVIIRQKLQLYYVANGQRVPEDLHIAHKLYLIDKALKHKRETAPFELQENELSMVVGASKSDKGLKEVSVG